MSSDQCNRMNVCGKRQDVIPIPQKNDALLGDLLSYSKSAIHIGHLILHGVVEDSRRKDGAQNAVHVIIKLVLRDFASLHSFLECVGEEDIVRLLHVESSVRSFGGRVCATPVGENESFKVEILLKHIGKQIAVFTREFAVHAAVGAHYGTGIGDPEGNLERAEIRFSHGTFTDDCVESIAAALLVVGSEVLQIANYVFRLDT